MTGTEGLTYGRRASWIAYNNIYVGWMCKKVTISVALAENGRGGEARQVGVFENRPEVLTKLAARLSKSGHRLSFCYKAGPYGYGCTG